MQLFGQNQAPVTQVKYITDVASNGGMGDIASNCGMGDIAFKRWNGGI
jgi:hypothetical protein